jgi:hypothetical protein
LSIGIFSTGVGAIEGCQAREAPEHGPCKGQGFKDECNDNDTTISSNGGTSRHEIGGGKGDATPNGTGITNANEEKDRADNAHDDIAPYESHDGPDTTHNHDEDERGLDQKGRNLHHDEEHDSGENHGKDTTDQGGINVAGVAVSARVAGIQDEKGLILQHNDSDDNGDKIPIHEKGKDWVTALAFLLFTLDKGVVVVVIMRRGGRIVLGLAPNSNALYNDGVAHGYCEKRVTEREREREREANCAANEESSGLCQRTPTKPVSYASLPVDRIHIRACILTVQGSMHTQWYIKDTLKMPPESS